MGVENEAKETVQLLPEKVFPFQNFFMKMLKRSHMFPSLNSIRAQFVSQKLTGYRKIFVIIYGGKIVEVARSDLKMVQNSSFLSKVKNFEGVFGLAQTVH